MPNNPENPNQNPNRKNEQEKQPGSPKQGGMMDEPTQGRSSDKNRESSN